MKRVIINRITKLSAIAPLVFIFSSCAKEYDIQPDAPQKPVTEEPFKGTVPFNTLTRTTNLQITKERMRYMQE